VHFLLPEFYGGTGVKSAFPISRCRGIGRLIKRKVKTRVAAEYPALARQMGITGKVKIEVMITAEGKVSSAKIVGGNPVLVTSAVDAVKKWKFEPGSKDTTEIIEFEFKDPNG